MNPDTSPHDGILGRLVDEQLELVATRIPVLDPQAVHPSPVDHDEREAAHASLDDVVLGKASATPEMLEELAALQDAPALSDEELDRQALAHGGADDDPSTPE